MDALPNTRLTCTQCGGELHHDQGKIFITCPFCGSTVYLDKTQVVFHWYLAPTLEEDKARSALARWMAGNQTVKDLDKKARLVGSSFEYFPMWYFKHRRRDGREEILLEPASATSIIEIKRLKLPAGDLRNYEQSLDPEARQPTVPLVAAQGWLQGRGLRRDEISESALVHLPVYTFKYAYEGQTYTAVVEAATGNTLANVYPAKAEAPYQMVAGLTLITFIVLATAPVLGSLFGGDAGLGIGLTICGGLGVPAALGFFGLAAWVASRV